MEGLPIRSRFSICKTDEEGLTKPANAGVLMLSDSILFCRRLTLSAHLLDREMIYTLDRSDWAPYWATIIGLCGSDKPSIRLKKAEV